MGIESHLEETFLTNLPLVERIAAIISRRHAMDPAEADEFAAWVKARIVGSDYAVFQKFRGRSSLSSYLTVVIANLFRDYRNARWGRWRPSAEAKRRGPVAIRLEELVYRDGHPIREAVQILRSCGATDSESELLRLAVALPPHYLPSEVNFEAATSEATVAGTSPSLLTQRDATLQLEEAVRSVVAELPPEDSLILQMRFWDDMSVADIARILRIDQKPLYRRIEGIQSRLRRALESRGLDHTRVRETLEVEPS